MTLTWSEHLPLHRYHAGTSQLCPRFVFIASLQVGAIALTVSQIGKLRLSTAQ
jgi:hypothetical protein